VVAPPKPVTVGTDTFAGWWRVDPATGHTLGVGATGWGQAMPEWAMTVLTIGTMSATAFLFEYLWCKLTGGGGAYVARSCEPSPPDRHPAALDYFIAPLEAADTYCLWSALEAAFLAVGFGLAGGMGGGGFGGEPGGAPGKPGRGGGEPGGGGEPPPDLAKTPPDLGDTLKGPPPGGAGRSGGGGGNRSSGGGGEETGGSGRSGAGADADDAALDEALRRAWDAQERGDEQGFTDAIRDMARITSPQRYLKYIPPPGEPAGAGPPKPPPPVTPPPPPPPPPCVGTGCDTSPMAKSIGGMGGAFDVLKKGGKQ